ncbi:MAG: ribbon-helix-helix domain-containing protein [archaeon]
MEAVCVKFDENLLRKMEEVMKENNYVTKTEFIRDAIRDKITGLNKNKAIAVFEKYFGTAKTHTSDEELHVIREKVSREFAKKHGIDLD